MHVWDPLRQFHWHFISSFLIRKLYMQAFCSWNLGLFFWRNQIGGKVASCSLNVCEPDGARKMPVWDPWFYQSTRKILVVSPWCRSLMFLSFLSTFFSVDLCNLYFPPPHRKKPSMQNCEWSYCWWWSTSQRQLPRRSNNSVG